MNETEREAQSYAYLNDKFEPLHVTSVPITDREALEYFSFVQEWFYAENVKYINKQSWDGDMKMLPFQYDRETREVTPIA